MTASATHHLTNMTKPTSPIWPYISLLLTIAYCVLASLSARQAESSYADERANDYLYQERRVLQRELMRMYIVEQMTIARDQDKPAPKARVAY